MASATLCPSTTSPEYIVFACKPLCGSYCYKELRAVVLGPAVRHGENAGFIEVEAGRYLIIEAVARASHARFQEGIRPVS